MVRYVIWLAASGALALLISLPEATRFWGPFVMFMSGLLIALRGVDIWNEPLDTPKHRGPWLAIRGTLIASGALASIPIGDGYGLVLGPLVGILIASAQLVSAYRLPKVVFLRVAFALSLPVAAFARVALGSEPYLELAPAGFGFIGMSAFFGAWAISGLELHARVEEELPPVEPAITVIPHYASEPRRCRLDADYNIVPLEEGSLPPIGILPWAGTETKA